MKKKGKHDEKPRRGMLQVECGKGLVFQHSLRFWITLFALLKTQQHTHRCTRGKRQFCATLVLDKSADDKDVGSRRRETQLQIDLSVIMRPRSRRSSILSNNVYQPRRRRRCCCCDVLFRCLLAIHTSHARFPFASQMSARAIADFASLPTSQLPR